MGSITFSDFQMGIAPLWYADDPTTIPIYNNPYGIIQYDVAEQRERVIYRPFAFVEDGVTKGYSSLYNVSDTVLRIRGIYVLPHYRNEGVGHRMWQQMADLFPPSFHRIVGFWREDSYERFIRHSGMRIVPGTGWIWSEFSKVNMRMLYWDRGTAADPEASRSFIDENAAEFSFGGTNNLNHRWSTTEWSAYAAHHAGNYPSLDFDLNFPSR